MKKILTFLIVILSVLLIYIGLKDKKIYYLSIGDSLSMGITPYNNFDYGYSDYIKDYLQEQNLLEVYVNSGDNNKRITDIISDIENNINIIVDNKNKTFQNALIKADLITISIGNNDLLSNIKINEEFSIVDLYDKFDQILIDYEKLFSLLRKYCKENIFILGLYNTINHDNIDDFFKYANSELKKLCDKYEIQFVDIYEEFNNNSYFPNPNSKIPNKEGYKIISEKIKQMLK